MEAITVSESSQAGAARRSAMALAKRLGFSEIGAGKLGIIVTELATNLVKHGVDGEMLIGGYDDETGSGVECLALDRGPGMANVDACLEDGYSTSGTSGSGLGAIARQSDVFDVYSQPGKGTAVLARLAVDPRAKTVGQARSGVVSVAYPGEVVCGDGQGLTRTADGFSVMVVDGLGHGIHAAEASHVAAQLFSGRAGDPPAQIAQALHIGLQKTRGAAVGIAQYVRSRGEVVFCGVGNIAGAVIEGATVRRMISHNGTIGHAARRIRDFEYPVKAPFLLILASDGLATSWTLDAYPGLQCRHPTLIAGVLYRDHYRKRDDVTVLVVRESAP